jgi:hypothetical protein
MAKPSKIETRKSATIAGQAKRASKSTAVSSTKTPSVGYDIGYGRPPRRTQFKPKTSGNPKGRPKATSRKQGSIAQATLEKKLATAKSGGARKSLRQLAFERIGEKASSGDIKSVNFLLARENEERLLAPNQFPVSTETAIEIMRAYFERERARKAKGDKS